MAGPSKFSKPAHKHACRLLYRCLLSHIPRTAIPEETKSLAISHIRRLFRKNHNLQGKHLRDELQAAYADEWLLRNAILTPNPTYTSRIISRITSIDAAYRAQVVRSTLSRKPKPPPGTPTPPTRKSKLRELALTKEEKARRSALVRQRPPKLHATNGFPVLHWPGRQQPAKIAAIILCKVKRKNEAVTYWKYMEDFGLNIYRYEDMWDAQVAQYTGYREPYKPGETAWIHAGNDVLKALKRRNQELEEKTMRITKRLEGVVKREEERYEKFLKERTREKRRKARQRRAYRDACKRAEIEGRPMPRVEDYIPPEPEEKPKIKGPGPPEGWRRWRDKRRNMKKKVRQAQGHRIWHGWVENRRKIRREVRKAKAEAAKKQKEEMKETEKKME